MDRQENQMLPDVSLMGIKPAIMSYLVAGQESPIFT
jgi:hypothetical protein